MNHVRRTAALLVLVLAVMAMLLAGCSGAAPYAVIVNGTRISQSELLRELNAIAANKTFVTSYEQNAAQAAASGQTSAAPTSIFGTSGHTYSQAFTAVVLNTDVQAVLIHAEVVRRNLEPTAAVIGNAATKTAAAAQFGSDPTLFDGFSSWFQHSYEMRAAEEQALTKALGPVDTSETAVRHFYDSNPVDFITTECVSHILVASQSAAASIRAKLTAGGDFAALAKQYSTDTGSGAKGGALGCNAPGGYVAPFERVADSIPLNQVSQPVQSQFGWHLIKVTARTKQALDLATAAKIVTYLKQQSPLSIYLAAEQPKIAVRVNPAYGTWDQTTGVVPPAAPPANSGQPTTTAAPSGAATGSLPPSATP